MVGRLHEIDRTQVVPLPVDEAFAFFADAFNLEAITPPWLRFRILTPRPIAMGEGALIDYRLQLHHAPCRWHTRIDTWVPGRRFVDRQLSGPFSRWDPPFQPARPMSGFKTGALGFGHVPGCDGKGNGQHSASCNREIQDIPRTRGRNHEATSRFARRGQRKAIRQRRVQSTLSRKGGV